MHARKAVAKLLLATSATAIATSAMASETVTHHYDALGRLVSTTTTGTVNNGLSTTTVYDPAGNRSTYTVTGAGGVPPPPAPPPPAPPPPAPPPPAPPPPPPPSTITVPATGTPQNLRSLADAAGYTGSSSASFTFTVNGPVSGTAGAPGSAGAAAIDTGTWPAGVSLTLHVFSGGIVSGGGGGGGNGGSAGGAGQAGGAGGDALYVRTNMTVIVDAGGTIRSGGGGGGGGGSQTISSPGGSGSVGGSGGGGGTPDGAGGLGAAGTGIGSSGHGANGSAGLPTGTGVGGTGSGPTGGNGGTYATSGTGGVTTTGAGGVGGGPGFAVRKNGNTVGVTNGGTITGTQG